MKIKNITKTFVVALAMMLALAIAPAITFGQNKADKKSSAFITDEPDNSLVGVWELKRDSVVFDCVTGLPNPNAPPLRVLYTFNQGGTMSEDNTDPIDGPYRTTAHGIWKHTYGQNYTASYMHYSFDLDRTHTFTIKVKIDITLSAKSNYFTENGTFEVLDAKDNDKVVFTGCFADTLARFNFDTPSFPGKPEKQ